MMDATARVVVCLCLGWAVCQVRGSYIPVEMNRTIQNLLQHYVSTVRAVVTLVWWHWCFLLLLSHTLMLSPQTHTQTPAHTLYIHYK